MTQPAAEPASSARRGPTRTAMLRLAVAALLLAASAWIWFGRQPPTIEQPRAVEIAADLFRLYVADTGDIAAHYAPPLVVGYPDGWEFTYGYRPCPGEGELRIFVTTGGRGSYTVTPDCNPVRGFATRPRLV